MSWIHKLYETYEKCHSEIGVLPNENRLPLLPICHTIQRVQIEIVIDQDGNFRTAKVVARNDSRTIIPCTENSGGRTGSKPVNHPLSDSLQFVSKDFTKYGGEVTSGYNKDPKEPFNKYRNALKKWCNSKYSHIKINSIYKYIEKGRIIHDLVESKVLFVGEDQKLLKRWNGDQKENIPEIFKLLPGKENKKNGKINSWQANAFVRWIVEIPGDSQSATWQDADLFEKWINYYLSIKQEQDFCYVTGQRSSIAIQHPAKIRNDGDKAKIISSNDTSGFTFRGRFIEAGQACSVGFEVTQKAHNALRWLLNKQGYIRNDQAIVAWTVSGNKLPDPLADAFFIVDFDEINYNIQSEVSTAQEFAIKFNKKIAGYNADLGDTTDVIVMGLDSVTTGRLSITFYREIKSCEFLTRLEIWHKTCSWLHNYHIREAIDPHTGEKKKVNIQFMGAPSPNDIVETAYGEKVHDKLRKATLERILPCIIDARKIPRDLVESCVQQACRGAVMGNWKWNKTLSITCALYRKLRIDYDKEEFNMALDEERTTRDYLYGRLLALADSLENWALKDAGESRPTNAARLMQRFAARPYSTWLIIELSLVPYIARLGNSSIRRKKIIDEVMAKFVADDYVNDRKLSGEFLLGYHCQWEYLSQNIKNKNKVKLKMKK